VLIQGQGLRAALSRSSPTSLGNFLGEAYRRQLANVREAARRIWQVPSLRDPVDQGLAHSLRLIDLLDGLTESLMATPRRTPLSQQEIYVLLASTYLHAIGLQDERAEPDPQARRQRYPEIGAEIVRSQGLPGEEQFRLDLVDDPSLLDAIAVVVAGHRRTDFAATEFEEFVHENQVFRPGLLAALLHLADSLDWSYQRVDLEFLQQSPEVSSLAPERALEGWLHYYVSGVRVAEDYIYLSFQLPTADLAIRELLAKLIEDPLRAEFKALEDTLWLYGVRLRFAPLAARPISTVQLMPGLVRSAALQRYDPPSGAPAPPPPRLVELAQRVLTTMGWVCDVPVATEDLLIPFVCRRRDIPATPERFVACKLGVVEQRDVHRAQALMPGSCVDGLVLAESRVLPSAQLSLAAPSLLRALTLADLYRELLDLSPSVNRQVEEFEVSELARYYQPLGCVRHSRDSEGRLIKDRYDSLESYVDTWLRESFSGPVRNHISILGDYGSGKTSFCRRYAARQGERWRQDPVHERIPLLIFLSDFSRTPEIPRLICEALANQYGPEKVTFEAFLRFNEDGKLVLLLDGFDEMAERSGRTTAVDNFWELARIVSPESKVLLTCRTQYFRSEGEAEAVLFDESSPAHPGASLKNTSYIDPSDLPNFEIVHLSPLTEEEIQRVLQSRLGHWETHWAQIQRIYNLRDLAQRPVMLAMIVSSLPQIQEGQILNPANLYRIYTDLWLEREVFKGRTLISPGDRRRFAEELALEMLRTNRSSLPHMRLRAKVVEQFGLASQEEVDYLETDIRTCNFLSRDAEGNYSFAHKSFMEFFAATHLRQMITKGKVNSPMPPINDEIRLFLHYFNSLDPIPEEETAPCASPEGFLWVPSNYCVLKTALSGFQIEWVDGFFASKCLVTNTQYARFLVRSLALPLPHWNGPVPPTTIADHPAAHVSQTLAQRYAYMVGASLPDSRQWQKAARGLDGRRFPWGEEWIPGRCNSAEEGRQGTTPMGAYSPQGDSPYGLQDICGNVWEWINEDYTAWGGSFSEPPQKASTLSSRFSPSNLKDQGFRLILNRTQALLRLHLQQLIDRLSADGLASLEPICHLLDRNSKPLPLTNLILNERELLLFANPEGPAHSLVRFVTLCMAGDMLHHPNFGFDTLSTRLGALRNSDFVSNLKKWTLIPIYMSPAQLLAEYDDLQAPSDKPLALALSRQLGADPIEILSMARNLGVFLVLDDLEKEAPFLDVGRFQSFLSGIRRRRQYRVVTLHPRLQAEPRLHISGYTHVMEIKTSVQTPGFGPSRNKSPNALDDLEICIIPAGRAWLGGDSADPGTLPLVEHVEESGFFLSRYPITNALFRRFMKSGGYNRPELWMEATKARFWWHGGVLSPKDEEDRVGPRDFGPPFNQPNHPVVGVTWYEALAFSRWLSGEMDRLNGLWEVLLPSETEWELAARGGNRIPYGSRSLSLAALADANSEAFKWAENPTPRRLFPWGDDPASPKRANFVETGLAATSAVGYFPEGASPCGAEDLAGNVWEWTRSIFEPDELAGETRVLRGGSFLSGAQDLCCSARGRRNPDHSGPDIGFRIVLRPRRIGVCRLLPTLKKGPE